MGRKPVRHPYGNRHFDKKLGAQPFVYLTISVPVPFPSMEMGKGSVFSGENISPNSKLFGKLDVTLIPLNITILFLPHNTPIIVLSPLKS